MISLARGVDRCVGELHGIPLRKPEQELGLEGAFDVHMELRLRQIVYKCL